MHMAEYGESTESKAQKKLHQRPLGYLLAILGGSLGGPFGLFVSPLVLLACNIGGEKVVRDKSGKETKLNVWAQWAVAGIVLAPMLTLFYSTLNPESVSRLARKPSDAVMPEGNQSTNATGAGLQQGATQMTQSVQPTSLSNSKRNAIRSAESYLSTMGFSRDGLIQQLSSQAGSGYSVEDATYAVDSLNVDWNAQAVRSAKSYLQTMGFSCDGLIQQLSSSAGSKFTASQATYGAQAAGACN